MKIRTGFVSNSSSSSFVCFVCGDHGVSYDGMEDLDMTECKEGHVFCNSHKLEFVPESKSYTFAEKKEMVLELACENLGFGEKREEAWERFNAKPDEEIEKIWDNEDWDEEEDEEEDEDEDDWREGEDIRSCPICQMEEYNTDEALHFLMLDNGLSKEDLLKRMRLSSENYEDFSKRLKNHPIRE